MKPVLFAEEIPTEISQTNTPDTAATPDSFQCPSCMMGATCGDCSMYTSSGYCRKYGGYQDPDHWACPWYYNS